MQQKSLTAPAVEFPENLKQGAKLEGFFQPAPLAFLPCTAVEAACCSSLMALNAAGLSQKASAHLTSWAEPGDPMTKASLMALLSDQENRNMR